MVDYNATRRFIKARRSDLIGNLPNRRNTIQGVFLHSTRSGHSTGDDGPGTENWMAHPDNRGAAYDALVWESGQQIKATRWENDEQPLWAGAFGNDGTWSAQQYYIHMEIGQGTISDPYTEQEIDSAAQWTAELARQYKFPIVKIPFLTQMGTPPKGITSHDSSANGVKLGKSDPGPTFPWKTFLAKANQYLGVSGDGEPMTPLEKEEFDLMKADIQQLRNQLWGEDAPRRSMAAPYIMKPDTNLLTMEDVAELFKGGVTGAGGTHSHPHDHGFKPA